MDQGKASLSKKLGFVAGGLLAGQILLCMALATQATSEAGSLFYMEIAGLVVLALIATFSQFWFVKNQVFSPVEQISKALEEFSGGHIEVTLPVVNNQEVGSLVDSAERLKTFLSDLRSQVSTSSSELTHSSRSLGDGTKNMGERIQETHSMSDQIATAMDEMTATAREVSGHASNAADQTHAMNASVIDGQKSMSDASGAIARLSSQMDVAVETVRKLAEDSSSVGKVLSVIRGIAEQTNLLALNAAIEAARAGEQGRGFAVVADEVRSLAQKTQESTQEIQVIIENVQNGAKNTTSVMDSSKAITTETQDLFTKAGERLEEIGRSIGELNSLNTHVARAVDEQTSAADSISRDVTRVAQIAEEFKGLQVDVEGICGQLTELSVSNRELEGRFGR